MGATCEGLADASFRRRSGGHRWRRGRDDLERVDRSRGGRRGGRRRGGRRGRVDVGGAWLFGWFLDGRAERTSAHADLGLPRLVAAIVAGGLPGVLAFAVIQPAAEDVVLCAHALARRLLRLAKLRARKRTEMKVSVCPHEDFAAIRHRDRARDGLVPSLPT